MSPALQEELRPRTRWSHEDMVRVARASSRAPFTLVFAPGSIFAAGALAALEGVSRLHGLTLPDASLSHANLCEIGNLPGLTRLDLKGSRFASHDFATLCQSLSERVSKLTEFWLENTTIGDEDLWALGKLMRLQMVILSGTSTPMRVLRTCITYRNSASCGWTARMSRTRVWSGWRFCRA